MNASPFPLLRLPLVPFGNIVRLINPLPLALCSKRCQNAVRALKLTTEYVNIKRAPDEYSVEINFTSHKNSWSFILNKGINEFEYPDCYALGGQVFQTSTECYDNGDNDFDILCEDRLSAVNVVEKFVKSIFHCKEICYNIDGNGNITEAVLEIINDTHSGSSEVELGFLGVNVRRGRNGTYRVPNLPPIENDALKLVLDTLREDIDLKINCCPGEEFQYDKPIRQKIFHMATANWFTFKNFMDAKCEYLSVNTMFRPPFHFSLKNVNTYLKRWNIGVQSHIRKILIKCEWNQRQINQTLFDGIDVYDIVETTQQDFFLSGKHQSI
ncbi:hypothetical protein CRE_24218 [Caenorhabditis remanei]|uniref:F-box domain-containing protein n=1 Tax=Caenorhabditis remanei TaxID=31234 RepID=E3NCV8_CAERE|nr:hypothetical protein CRE_24218 [Caenorhabditis remanei]